MWLMLIVFVLTILYYLIQRHYNYWKNYGVPGPRPLPLVGNYGLSFIGKRNAGQVTTDIYSSYEGYPFVGIYKATTPALLVRDPDLLKCILIKDFKHFHDNDMAIDKEVEPLFGRHPFVLKGQEWRRKRAHLTYCFTSGKIKGMFVFLDKNSTRMIRYIDEVTKTSTNLEAREVCIRYTLDNVAACAFGAEGKSFDEKYSDFRELADKFLSPDSINKVKFLLFAICPWVGKFLKMKIVSEEVEKRLIEIVVSTLEYRKKNKIVRNDFLDAMSQISTEDGEFTDMDIVANAASFFGDGYETSSRVMSYVLFELACNPGAQGRLREEINESFTKHQNKFTYEAINENAYLDACLNESMRKNSMVYQLNKICTEDFTYTPTNSDFKQTKIDIKAGTSIILPTQGFQNDPKYFDDPDKYIPERFLTKHDKGFKQHVYFPFGDGPRVCLGQRFGVIQIKTGIAHIIKNFQLTVNQKTKLPLKIDPFYIMPDPVGGLWLDFVKIH